MYYYPTYYYPVYYTYYTPVYYYQPVYQPLRRWVFVNGGWYLV